jgi:hypothetical protein
MSRYPKSWRPAHPGGATRSERIATRREREQATNEDRRHWQLVPLVDCGVAIKDFAIWKPGKTFRGVEGQGVSLPDELIEFAVAQGFINEPE